jgi:hypothetical protein
MESKSFAPSGSAVFTRLGVPSDFMTHQNHKYELAVKQHPYRGEKCGEHDLGADAQREPYESTIEFGLPLLEQDEKKAQQFG